MIRRAVALVVLLSLSCLLIPLIGEAPRSAAA